LIVSLSKLIKFLSENKFQHGICLEIKAQQIISLTHFFCYQNILFLIYQNYFYSYQKETHSNTSYV